MTYTVNYKGFRMYVELFNKHLKHINIKKKKTMFIIIPTNAHVSSIK